MILGVCAWPAMLAALHKSTEDQDATPATRPLLWAALAGGLLGLAGLGGAHYPVAFGIFLALLMVWARHTPKGYHFALLALWALPLATWERGIALRPALEIASCLVLVAGAAKAVHRKSAALSLGGFALGLAASNGTLLTLGAHRAADVGRIGFDNLRSPDWSAQSLSLLLQPEVGELESFFHFPHPIIWLLLIGGLVALFRKAPALATVGVAFLLLAWTVGRPLRIWTPLALSPGMMAADSQMRMQWLVLLLGPLGALGGLSWATERLRSGPPRAVAQAALAGLVLFWGLQSYQPPALGAAAQELPQSLGQVSRVADPAGVYSASSLEGSIVPEYYSDPESVLFLRPEEAGDSIHWSSEEGHITSSNERVQVDAVLDRWTVAGPPNTRVVLAQKDLPGWDCEGGIIDPDLKAIAAIDALLGQREDRSPGAGNWWLSVRLGASGKAICRWRPPGLRLGVAVQITAGIALLGLLGWVLLQRKPN